jgi:cytochrome c553
MICGQALAQGQPEGQGLGEPGGDAGAGQAKSAICAACHGADGNSIMPQWPSLAGQHADYLARQTSLIKANNRPVPEMTALVAGLSDQDILDLAAYFSGQNLKPGVADEAKVAAGRRLYQAGNPETGIPACMSCHGPVGEGNPLAGYPALAGQQTVYAANMLKKFRAGEHWGEDDAPSMIMNGVAARLTDAEIEAVVSYTSGLYRAE